MYNVSEADEESHAVLDEAGGIFTSPTKKIASLYGTRSDRIGRDEDYRLP